MLKSFLRSAMTKVSVQSVVPAKEGEAAPLLDSKTSSLGPDKC